MFGFFHVLLATSLFGYVLSNTCDTEMTKRDLETELYDAPDVTQHIGPVTISSLNLTSVFDCLRNISGPHYNVGYTTGVVGVKVNISMDDICTLDEDIIDRCCTTNQFGLDQLDYLVFTEGGDDTFNSLSQAEHDTTVVYSNIMDGWGFYSYSTGVLTEYAEFMNC